MKVSKRFKVEFVVTQEVPDGVDTDDYPNSAMEEVFKEFIMDDLSHAELVFEKVEVTDAS